MLVLLAAAMLGGDRWLLPRLLPRPGQPWTKRDERISTLIAVGSMLGTIIGVLVALELSVG
jgi:hypothetical protein